MLEEDRITEAIIGAAIEVHRQLGPGLFESTYEACLVYELKQGGWKVERQIILPVIYKGVAIEEGYRIDLLVEHKVIVEIKAVISHPMENGQRRGADGKLVPGTVRALLARMARHAIPGLHVLAYHEVPEDKRLRVMSAVG